MDDTTDHPVDRQTLYNEVWSEPVSVVAPRYGLSDVGLAKICRSLAIPLPSRGYWAKVKAGKLMKRVPLPKFEGAERISTGLKKLPPAQAAAREDARMEAARLRTTVRQRALEPAEETPQHPLVKATSKRLRQRGSWPTDTQLRSAPAEVLNLAVTPDALDRALLITDRVLKALAPHGVNVRIDKERSVSLLEVQSPSVTMEFSLTEHVRRMPHEVTPAEELARERFHRIWIANPLTDLPQPSIPQYDYHPTGVLTLKVGTWPVKRWRDTSKTTLERRLAELVAGILALARELHEKAVEEARRARELREAQERYEFITQRRAEEVERFKQLEAQVTDWERATRLRSYADAVERRAQDEGELRGELIEWLAWARAKADWLDPHVPVCDVILDAPEPKRPGWRYW